MDYDAVIRLAGDDADVRERRAAAREALENEAARSDIDSVGGVDE